MFGESGMGLPVVSVTVPVGPSRPSNSSLFTGRGSAVGTKDRQIVEKGSRSAGGDKMDNIAGWILTLLSPLNRLEGY
jgi:hypothetical protein